MNTLLPDSVLQNGKYIIKKVLGQGGFGITYLAEHSLLGIDVAIKEFFMKDLCNRDATSLLVSVPSVGSKDIVTKFKAKFLKEAKNIAQLNHPNIIRVIDIFEENNTAYYVMEYCSGGSLSELLAQNPNGLPENQALKYTRDIASALQYIHERKMNHLDVKPANVMLNADGHAVLIDFGLSKQYDATGSQTSTTPIGISHGYAPIEQYKQGGVSEFSPAADIYSLGATLFKLITGQTPPDAQTLIDEDIPTINASEPVANAIQRAMQIKRINRPQSISAWIHILEPVNQYDITTVCTSVDNDSTQMVHTAYKDEFRQKQESKENIAKAVAEKERQERDLAREKAKEEADRNALIEKQKKEEINEDSSFIRIFKEILDSSSYDFVCTITSGYCIFLEICFSLVMIFSSLAGRAKYPFFFLGIFAGLTSIVSILHKHDESDRADKTAFYAAISGSLGGCLFILEIIQNGGDISDIFLCLISLLYPPIFYLLFHWEYKKNI